MKLTILNFEGKSVGDVELSDKIFSIKPSKNLIQILVDWQISRFKSRTAKTKQRNEIKGSTRKIYAQNYICKSTFFKRVNPYKTIEIITKNHEYLLDCK